VTIRLPRQNLLHRIGCLVTERKDGIPVFKLSFPLVFLRFCCCSSLVFHVSRGRSAQSYPARTRGRDSRYSLSEHLANRLFFFFFFACAGWWETIAVCSCDMPEAFLADIACRRSERRKAIINHAAWEFTPHHLGERERASLSSVRWTITLSLGRITGHHANYRSLPFAYYPADHYNRTMAIHCQDMNIRNTVPRK